MAEVIRRGRSRRTVRPSGQSGDGVVEDFDYAVEVDWAAVGKLALRAANSKNGTAEDGPVTVRVVERRTNALIPKVNIRDANDNYITTVDLTDDLLDLLVRDNTQGLDRKGLIDCLESGNIVHTKTASYRKAH